MERLLAMMAFCETPLDDILASSAAARHGASATGDGNKVALLKLDAPAKKGSMEKLAATMAFCEAPLDGIFGCTFAPSSNAVGYGSSATGGGDVAAAAKKWPMEKFAVTMAFCEAPLDGTLAPSLGGAGYGSSATRGGDVAAAVKKWPVERLVATMTFCETPFDGTFDETSTPSSTSSATARSSGGDEAALRRAWLAGAKEWPLREHRLLLCQKAGTVVDGLAIFMTVALE